MPGKLSDRLWGPLFARGYDRMSKGAEDAGLREKRRELLARARGRTLELGSGTGANLGLYPGRVTELVLTEPDAHMRVRLEGKVASECPNAEIVAAEAERLPFPDSSFDTVVATLVLCTIPAPRKALEEISRVLKPDGRLLFLEHVRSEDPALARFQDRMNRLNRFLVGCECNRETLTAIEAAGFTISRVERTMTPEAPKFVRPLVVGAAVAA